MAVDARIQELVKAQVSQKEIDESAGRAGPALAPAVPAVALRYRPTNCATGRVC